jgi:hypothetical protein
MAIPFYNTTDQNIYAGGEHFIPQQQYRLNYNSPHLPPAKILPIQNQTGITNTNAAYNYGSQGAGGPFTPANQLVGNYNAAIAARQGRLQDPSSSWLQNILPSQRSAQDMLASGVKDERRLEGIPFGIGAMLSRALPDNYYKMPLGEQIFIQSRMGYSDPNTNMGNKDPFGINVRSAFGNYADYTTKRADKLGDLLSGNLSEKYGAKFNTLTGLFESEDQAAADHANRMTKMLREQYGFYSKGKNKLSDIRSDVGLIDKAKEQDRINKDLAAQKSLATAHKGFLNTQEAARMTAQEQGQRAAGMGGGSRQAKSGSQKAGGSGRTDGGWGWAEGGRIGLRTGGDPHDFPEQEDLNIYEFMQDQGVPHGEMVETSPFDIRVQELMDEGLSWQEAYTIAEKEFGRQAEAGDEMFSEEGLASLV